MARIELITAEAEPPAEVRRVAERIIETRGEISRPFQVLLHSPALAERVAELGHLVRSGSSLGEADRELVTLATGFAVGCDFVSMSHAEAASTGGLSADTIAILRGDRGSLGTREAAFVAFVAELCGTGTVSARSYDAVHQLIGTRGVVEVAVTVGYYTMLARVMGAVEAC